MKDRPMNEAVIQKTAKRCKERGIVIPTFSQQMHPEQIPDSIKKKLPGIGLWDVNPLNLFRISWKNDVKSGLYGDVNTVEIPREITGTKARVIGLVGKYFPTGAHKVGAAFGCLVPRLVTGEFDPETQKAVWPSTGNYCRGGAFDCALLDCTSVAILPEGMSRERFEWLHKIGAEVIATPGCESNVKEIYDKCWEIKKTRKDAIIFNQFEEFGNSSWHYHVTGNAVEEAFRKASGGKGRLAAYVSSTGSAGTISAGDYLRKVAPGVRVAATEALQCPTLLMNGFGDHRIEGIGDKHVPWVHNVRNTNAVVAVDDENTMRVLRLFNDPAGRKALLRQGVSEEVLNQLPLLGISSICNMLAAIKMAKYFEFGSDDVIMTIFTDSAEMYQSRLGELTKERGAYNDVQAEVDLERYLRGVGTDNMKELGYYDQKALHNLKYFTWVEQQGRTAEELRELWDPEFWDRKFSELPQWDQKIKQFNERVAAL
ncbi:MAG: pyridoxal-5-phosphate-dependent protein subunit beta [Bdellovibrionales bacterium GWB1_55_8]|nr:MAG: pyridoxal-5-phosphate-dependent protein subunit beta [Bdellovibrionales bacterium GWB1_55_8]